MSVVGNPLMLGGGKPGKLAAFIVAGNTVQYGSDATRDTRQIGIADSTNFAMSNDNVFTCLKPGTYSITIAGLGGYGNNSSTFVGCRFELWINTGSGKVLEHYNTASSSTNPNYASYDYTLKRGDTVEVRGRGTSGSATVQNCFAMSIRRAD